MAKRKPFLLRLDPKVHDAMKRWADDELRSLNGQIEFILRKALREGSRLDEKDGKEGTPRDAKHGKGDGA